MEDSTLIETASVFESDTQNTLGTIHTGNTCIGCGNFSFSNGDTYSGFFKANKDKNIFREGIGVYTTADGHSYDGAWEEDGLEGEDALVTFSDGSYYNGSIKNMKYDGDGRYTFPDGTYIDAKFSNNCPIEGKESPNKVRFMDKAGNKWIGNINSNNIIMLPVHHFIPKEWKVPLSQFPMIKDSESLGVPLKIAKPKLNFFHG